MDNRLFIDGVDVYQEYGVYVTEGGWNQLVQYPPMKRLTSNDWHEEDGLEVDLSEPTLDTRPVQITFGISGLFSQFFSFVDMLSDRAYHTFDTCFNRIYTLRLTQQPNFDYAKRFSMATLSFAADNPWENFSFEEATDGDGNSTEVLSNIEPKSTVVANDDYSLDDRPLTDYGVRVLEGSLSSVLKTSSVKPNLTVNVASAQGATYYDGGVTFQSRDVALNCLMRAETLDELWSNYDALLYDLTRPQKRRLYVREMEQEFDCCYKSSTVQEFYPDGKIWLKFTLTLTLLGNLRVSDDDILLADEDYTLIDTEDEVDYIDMEPIGDVLLTTEDDSLVLTEDGGYDIGTHVI